MQGVALGTCPCPKMRGRGVHCAYKAPTRCRWQPEHGVFPTPQPPHSPLLWGLCYPSQQTALQQENNQFLRAAFWICYSFGIAGTSADESIKGTFKSSTTHWNDGDYDRSSN